MNTRPLDRHPALLFLAIAAASLLSSDTLAAKFHWVDMPGQSMERLHGDRPVLRYMDRAYDDSTATGKALHRDKSPVGVSSTHPQSPIPNRQSAPDNSPPEGFIPLFNGRDLSGWKGLVGNPKSRAKMSEEQLAAAQAKADEQMRAHWKVEEGALVFDGKGKSLCTAKDYGDFEMYVTWKIKAKGDSGIYLRGSPQLQIWDTENEAGFKHGTDKGSGALWNNKKHERFPLVKADKPVGQWNTFYIKMIGERVTVKLNGQLVTDNVVMDNYWERDKPIYPTGQIELQDHGNTLWFKNIYIRAL